MRQELRRDGMALVRLWDEHATQYPGQSTHRYSQLCERLCWSSGDLNLLQTH